MEKSIRFLKGVGEARAKSFQKLGIDTVSDLLYFFPRAHEDRSEQKTIDECADGETVCVTAIAATGVSEVRIRKNMSIFSMMISDDTGLMKVVWYNNKYVKKAFDIGKKYVFFGKVQKNRNKLELTNPIYETEGTAKYTGKIIPIYPLTQGLGQKNVQSVMQIALDEYLPMNEYLPEHIRDGYKLAEINYAMKNIHFPESFEAYKKARERFIFEELLTLQLALFQKRGEVEKAKGEIFSNVKCAREFTDTLPFSLTNAQKRTINEIASDLKSGILMNRLVQGDVGSGKTAVAAAAVYMAYANKKQSVLMAPTEILAAQHMETFKDFFKSFPISIVKLTGGMSAKEKREAQEKIESGEANLIIGTHAVIEDKVKYYNLGLVIVDEQHRFGVRQRAKLMAKGENPHMMVMSATPIPRTLALILYGDLSISIIDELPPGRKPVKTFSVKENMRHRVYDFLEKNVKEGNQAYIVCPLIEETESTDLKNAVELCDKIKEIFPHFNVDLIHGKMKPKEKDEIMAGFSSGKTHILVSTTVIEVGVNVPKANVMIIENAERFGLSQLHQLRGRVGRGCDEAFCIMFSEGKTDITKKRMDIMCKSNDGFYISEQDLALRGPGDFFGTRQHGLPEMKIANLFEDRDYLKKAQECADVLFASDPFLQKDEHSGLKIKVDKILESKTVLN